ncbi:MAG: type II secretion system F family protein [Pseudonocardiales bacterium]
MREWLLLAAAVWVAPIGPSVRVGRASMPRRIPLPALRVVLALALAAACVAVLSPVRGLLIGGLLIPVACHVLTRLARRAVRRGPDRSLALTLDLLAAALHSGQPVSAALVLAAPAAGPVRQAQLDHVAGLLRLGADPAEAWRVLAADGVLAPVAQAACRSAHSGIQLARGMAQVAAEVRAGVRAVAEARAHRAGVWAMAPLGLCFLPAFVCLGVIPVVVGIAATALRTVP